MDALAAAELADNFGDIVFLEEADSSDAGGSGFEAERCVVERNTSESQHGNFVLAGLAKAVEADGFGDGGGSLFEDRSEQDQVGFRDCGLVSL